MKIDLQNWLDEPFLVKEKPPDIEVQGGFFKIDDFITVFTVKSILLFGLEIYLERD